MNTPDLFYQNYSVIGGPVFGEAYTYISTEYFEDIVFVLCLEKKDNIWEIIYDFSRNDVPSEEEIIEIKKEFPANFPKKMLPDFWQKRLE